ncbi:hypothetical protein GCM10009850_047740 [Nonomuraea monospora]|uniref:Recombination endonuclease VII n=1 Tax=Nonomuraea monospora TaxID=568818 RepID=A0ABN3CIM5_9ACTN
MIPPAEPRPEDTKQCTRCGETKPRTEFYETGKSEGKLKSWCKACCAEMSRKWTENNSEHVKKYRRQVDLLRTYGLMPTDYLYLLQQQGGVCAICGQDEHGSESMSRLVVDHCHKTGKVRGLLCRKCNSAIGFFDDDPERCVRASSYLKREGGSVDQGVGPGLERPVR